MSTNCIWGLVLVMPAAIGIAIGLYRILKWAVLALVLDKDGDRVFLLGTIGALILLAGMFIGVWLLVNGACF